MTTPSTQSNQRRQRDAAYWAQQVSTLKVSEVPAGAVSLNVEGRRVVGPVQGFGTLWQKTYRVRLTDLTAPPAEVMRIWKENFPRFQPPGNHFYPTMTGIQPGALLFVDSHLPVLPGLPGIVPMAAGVMSCMPTRSASR